MYAFITQNTIADTCIIHVPTIKEQKAGRDECWFYRTKCPAPKLRAFALKLFFYYVASLLQSYVRHIQKLDINKIMDVQISLGRNNEVQLYGFGGHAAFNKNR